jgi:hypothetical protein
MTLASGVTDELGAAVQSFLVKNNVSGSPPGRGQ